MTDTTRRFDTQRLTSHQQRWLASAWLLIAAVVIVVFVLESVSLLQDTLNPPEAMTASMTTLGLPGGFPNGLSLALICC